MKVKVGICCVFAGCADDLSARLDKSWDSERCPQHVHISIRVAKGHQIYDRIAIESNSTHAQIT
jgi:hypothetical protein